MRILLIRGVHALRRAKMDSRQVKTPRGHMQVLIEGRDKPRYYPNSGWWQIENGFLKIYVEGNPDVVAAMIPMIRIAAIEFVEGVKVDQGDLHAGVDIDDTIGDITDDEDQMVDDPDSETSGVAGDEILGIDIDLDELSEGEYISISGLVWKVEERTETHVRCTRNNGDEWSGTLAELRELDPTIADPEEFSAEPEFRSTPMMPKGPGAQEKKFRL